MAKIYQPTLVIGLGGTGKGIILALKKMIAENSAKGLQDFPFLRVLSVDTDVNVPSIKSSIDTIEERDLTLDQHKEIFGLGSDFVSIPDLDSYPEIKSWFPSSMKSSLLPAELKKGAGQKKSVGRFSFSWNATNFYSRLQNSLSNIVDIKTTIDRGIGSAELSQFINIFICCSICGGTGAGSFLDTAYMVKDITKKSGKTAYVYGIFALDTIFQGIQGDFQIKPNCYASLVELDHYSNEIVWRDNPYQRFRPQYKNFIYQYENSVIDKPFDFPFMFDKTNQDGKTFNDTASFYEMGARFIYLLTGHEVANDYYSMDSNVRTSLEATYKREFLNKTNIYRSMGVYSVMFPKRMVIQLCGYNFVEKVLEILLNDDYKDYDIEKYTKGFLSKYKINTENNQINDFFNQYKKDDNSVVKFKEYLTELIDNFDIPKDKKEIIPDLQRLFNDLQKEYDKYKDQSLPKGKELKRNLENYLIAELKELTGLRKYIDSANDKEIRGSVKRAEFFIEELINTFQKNMDVYRKEEENSQNQSKQFKSDFDITLQDLQQAVNSIIPSGGKITNFVTQAKDNCYNYFASLCNHQINGLLFQFCNNIMDKRGSIDEPGIISYLQDKLKFVKNLVSSLNNIKKDIYESNTKNKNYKSGNFCAVLFDYKEDVENNIDKLFKEKGENNLYEIFSDNVKSKYFGDYFEKTETLADSIKKRNLLKEAESLFFDLASEINIENKIIENPEVKRNFENGTYLTNAGIFIGLDGDQLNKVNIQLEKSKFFAITIPDTYVGLPCESIKGNVSGSAGKKICPVDENRDKYQCSKYGKCLKQVLLNSSPLNLSIIPCDDKSEVNIIQTFAGFPLHAINSVRSAKTDYLQVKKKNEKDNELNGRKEEGLHMFGLITFPDLLEPTENTKKKIDSFKQLLLIAYSLNYLKIEKLKIAFFVNADYKFKREQPSLVMGKNLDEVISKMQSYDVNDIEIITMFTEETKGRLKKLIEGGKQDEIIKRLKDVYIQMNSKTKIPEGFTIDDSSLLDEYSKETFNVSLNDDNYELGVDDLLR